MLLGVTDFDADSTAGQGHDEDEGHGGCGAELRRNTLGFLVTLCLTLLLEVAVAVVSMRGSIFNHQPRSAMTYLLYARFGMSIITALIPLRT